MLMRGAPSPTPPVSCPVSWARPTADATTAGALRGYAPELRHAQSVADAALADAKQAQASVDANRPLDYPPAGSPTPAQVSAERQRQYAYDEGVDALNAARRKLTDATDHRDEHAGRAARTIRDNIDDDGLKDSWWDRFTNWVSEHADLLKAIAKIAELVATVLSTIALAISWIPVLNFLTPVLLGLAALASVVAFVCTVMLALAGEGSWADVGLALLGAVPVLGRAAKGALAARRLSKVLCKADPVDVAGGRVVLTQTDVELAGVLPLVLSRTHLSSHRVGRWFGPSWASTLDQRLEVEETGVYFAAEDGMLLAYPAPTGGVAVLPEEGPRWPLRRTEDDYTITDPERGQTLHFAPTGPSPRAVLPLRAITDRGGHRIDLDYEPDGTLSGLRHSGGHRIEVATTGGRITALRLLGAGSDTDADVVLIRYGYDQRGQLNEVINSSGVPMRLDYDSAGRLTGWQDRNDLAYRYTYDEAGRCVRTSGAEGYMNGTFAYDPANRVTVFTDSHGHASTFYFNDLDQVIREVDPLGRAMVSVWDRYDRLLSRTDPLGRSIRYTYDQVGNLIEIIRPDGSRAFAEYNELHLPVQATDPDGATWQHTYDERGNLTALTDPLGATTTYGYDERGHLVSITDAVGNVRRMQTDTAGLLTAVTDPLGATTGYTRDGFGRVVAITDPVGGVTRFGWTTEGKLAWRALPDGATERWSYDGEGNLVEHLDALGQATRTEIGPFDLPTAEIGPDGARLEFGYDTELRLVSVTNPQGLVWRYDYDPAGNLIRETDFNHRELTYVHDATGQLIERTNGAGQAVRFVRNLLGAVVEQRAGSAVTTFDYDPLGRIVRATNDDADLAFDRDPRGRIIAETCNGRTITSSYDSLGRRTHRRTPSGADSAWEHDANDQPVALHTAGRTLRFNHDPAGREVERHLGTSAVLTQAWDANHQLRSQTLTAGGLGSTGTTRQARSVQHRAYRYRPDGYVTTIEDHLSGARRFDLDPVGQVTAVHGVGWTEGYAYDTAGNTTHANWPASSSAESLAVDARGEREYTGTLIQRAGYIRYEHDAQGRVILRQQKRLSAKPRTWHYTWDARDRLVAVITPDRQHWRYCYDPLGRRIAKQHLDDDGTTVVEQVNFTWDDVVLAEQTHTDRDRSGRTTVWEWEPGTFRPVSQTERAPLRGASQEWIDEQFYAIVTDLVGTPTELVNADDGSLAWHTRSTLWGLLAAQQDGDVSCPLRFPGQYHDSETGLNYNYFRYYDPSSDRYESTDPLGLEGGLNPHVFVPNPILWFDPLGLKCTGSYTNTFASGRTYHGKGSRARSQRSARRIARRYGGDDHVATDWKPAANNREAFKAEARRIDADGGVDNPMNYNQFNSPGKKMIEEDGW